MTGSRLGPGVPAFRSTARGDFQSRLAAAQTGQPPRALALDQRLERFPDEQRLLLNSCEVLRRGNQIIIKDKRGAHGNLMSLMHTK
jgi:hypothetical protein